MAHVELIAEVSSNHGGDVALAKEFIWRFAEAGADWIKFQTTRVRHLNPTDPQYEWFRQVELSDEAHWELKDACEHAGVKFLTTVYNKAEVPFLAGLRLAAIKIGSGEAGEDALVRVVTHAGFPRVFISDGLRVPKGFVHERLRCISRYPAPHGCVPTTFYPRYVGWSDHCCGLASCQVAIIRGATVIEKHVQLPQQARPCRTYEATVEEFKELRRMADEDPTRFLGRWQYA